MKWSNNLTFGVIVALAAVALSITVKNRTHLGLDLRGGSRLVFQARKTKDVKDIKEATSRAREVIERRLSHSKELGISEPEVMTQGENRIVVSIPEVKDPEKAKTIIGKTARLEFKYIKKIGKKKKTEVILTGTALKDARVAYDNLRRPVVSITFTKKGGKIFGEFTRRHVGDVLSIYLDKSLVSSPTIDEPILTGSGQITGDFTPESAQELATLLVGGALPVPLKLIEERTIGPTLGKMAIQRSLKAGAIGIVIIFLFMLFYYRLPGFVGCIALSLYGLFTYALVVKVPVILTLPGIAGLILSLGMAVDANILIYERLKEELREGKTLHAAVDVAFQRAWTAILDSNVTTAITCAVLWYFGTGPIIGFAKTLLLGIACSMFTAIVCTRSILHLMMNVRLFQKPVLHGYSPLPAYFVRKGIGFVNMRKTFFILSAVVLIPSVVALLPPRNIVRSFPPETGLLKGVDFAGGTMLNFQLQKHFSIPNVRNELRKVGLSKARFQKTAKQGLLIRTKKSVDGAFEKRVIQTLRKHYGKVELLEKDFVGPVMTKDLTHKAFYAVLISSLLIMIYLTLRFLQFRFGVCAVIALIHDIGIMAGSFALFGKFFGLEVDSLFVTAALTVIGYSVNDTVVVFDRIRENLRRKRERTLPATIDRSLQETFARSINTTLTTMVPIVSMLLLGGASLRNFLLALFIGFVSGAYSSLFIASPLLLVFEKEKTRTSKKQPSKKKIASPVTTSPKLPSAPSTTLTKSQEAVKLSGEKKKEKKKKKKKKKAQRRR